MKITLEITNEEYEGWKYFLTKRYGKKLLAKNLFKKAIAELVGQEAQKYLDEEGYTNETLSH
jgi:hypothetical protein